MGIHIAAFILNNPNLPKDGVPYWDFNAPNIPNEPGDVSAAAIMASALYELSTYSKNKKKYLINAEKIMTAPSRLCEPYPLCVKSLSQKIFDLCRSDKRNSKKHRKPVRCAFASLIPFA